MMTRDDFIAKAGALAREIGVHETHHGYFLTHRTRLYETCQRFTLFERDLGDVLDIGPFYSYTPFLLRSQARSYHVIEGNDPAAHPLRELYASHGVHLRMLNLMDTFGPDGAAARAFPYAENSFDTILCWETMEHLNFNPVPFVRELWRITRPGGRVYLTVPNRASAEAMVSLLTNRNQRSGIDAYYQFADYACDGKRLFMGFHWREYTLTEFAHLFHRAGFTIVDAGWLMYFQDDKRLSLGRKAARALLRCCCSIRPAFGKNCYLIAEKRA